VTTSLRRGVNPAQTHTGQCFPLYCYEEAPQGDLLGKGGEDRYIRRHAITDAALTGFRKVYANQRGTEISKEDLFYYV
jgi:predicted helicase